MTDKSAGIHSKITAYLICKGNFSISDIANTVHEFSGNSETENTIRILDEVLESNMFIKNKNHYILQGI